MAIICRTALCTYHRRLEYSRFIGMRVNNTLESMHDPSGRIRSEICLILSIPLCCGLRVEDSA